MVKETGEAYAFFYCGASKQEIEGMLPEIRKDTRTPSELELSLTGEMDTIKGDDELKSMTLEAQQSGRNYLLKAVGPSITNRKAAYELAAVLKNVYLSPLYETKEPFYADVLFQENGNYIFRD